MRWRGSAGVSLLLAYIGGMAWAWALWPPERSEAASLDAWLGTVCLACAMVGWAMRSVPGYRAGMVLSWVTALLLAALVGSRATAQGQVMFAAGFLVLGMISAAIVPRRLLPMQVVGLTAVFAFATAVADGAAVQLGVSLGVAMVVCSVMVAHLVATTDTLVERLADAAWRDPLTGALNRRGAELEANAIQSWASRIATRPTVVVVIDLDDFKEYNDRHGHSAGDALLAGLVAEWSAALRVGDILARMGGDEFVAVLPNAGMGEANAVLTRMRTVSPSGWTCGAVEWAEDETFPHALDRADRELYAAKRSRKRSGLRSAR